MSEWDEEFICGETQDHQDRVTHQDEDARTVMCDRCGAEWFYDLIDGEWVLG